LSTALATPREKRREQQRAKDTKAAVLEAALEVFADLGFDGATTRGIAERAGVKHPVIAHHFGDKESLWKATAAYVFGLYSERIEKRRSGLKGVDEPVLLRLLLKEFILFSADVPAFHRFMMQANRGDQKRLKWLADRFLKAGSKNEAAVLARAQVEGVFDIEGDPIHLRYLFIGAATSVFAFAPEFKLVSRKDPFSDKFIEQHAELVLSLFKGQKS